VQVKLLTLDTARLDYLNVPSIKWIFRTEMSAGVLTDQWTYIFGTGATSFFAHGNRDIPYFSMLSTQLNNA